VGRDADIFDLWELVDDGGAPTAFLDPALLILVSCWGCLGGCYEGGSMRMIKQVERRFRMNLGFCCDFLRINKGYNYCIEIDRPIITE
jgi:hypothetical protein